MKTQHTQGEWEVSTDDFNTNYTGGGYSIKQKDGDGYCIATIEDIKDKENFANAKLIAAAPITIEELYKTNEYLKSLIKNDCIKGIGTIETIKGIIRANEQAIKKATE